MGYDVSGVFTRSYNWVNDKNSGIRITATRMDSEFDNFATGMNQVFLRNGVVPMTGTFKAAAGSLAAPGIQFATDTNSGLYSSAIGKFSAVASGAEVAEFSAAGLKITGSLDFSTATAVFRANAVKWLSVSTATGTGVLTLAQNSGDTNASVIEWRTNDGLTLKGSITANTSGNLVLTAQNAIVDKNGYELGYKLLPQNAQTAAYTLALTDVGKHVYFSTGSTVNVNIPPNSDVAFGVGSAITIVNDNSAEITFVRGTGVALIAVGLGDQNHRLSSLGVATLMKVGTNRWFLVGAGVRP